MSQQPEVNINWEQVVQDLGDQIKALTVHNAVLRAAIANLQKENANIKSQAGGITLA
jgi:cell division protein FtsB